MITVALHRLVVLSPAVLGGPPLILAAAIGLGIHHHRTRRAHP